MISRLLITLKNGCFVVVVSGYIGEFEIVDDHRSGKIVVNLTGRLNKVHKHVFIYIYCYYLNSSHSC